MTYATVHILRFVILFVILSVSFFFAASPAKGYFTTGQEEIPLDEGTSGLFLIDYSFGSQKRNVHMPVLAERGVHKLTDAVSYEIFDETGAVAGGRAVGIVLSSAPMQNDEYVIPHGSAGKFTLMVAYIPDTPVPTVQLIQKKYRLQVTYLPFKFDGTQQLQLNPSELTYYTTALLPIR